MGMDFTIAADKVAFLLMHLRILLLVLIRSR